MDPLLPVEPLHRKPQSTTRFHGRTNPFASTNIPDGFFIYEVIMGKEQPLYILVQSAKDPADYFSLDYSEALGEEATALQGKLCSLIRKIEYKQAWIARNLSYGGPEK